MPTKNRTIDSQVNASSKLIYLRAIRSKLLLRLFLVAFVLADSAASQVKDQTEAQSRVQAELSYQRFIQGEWDYYSSRSLWERGISGGSVLLIGLYGHYFDRRGPVSSAVYGLAQTTGVLLLSETIYDSSHYSLFWSLDRRFKDKGSMSYSEFKQVYARYEIQRQKSLAMKSAYTSLVLAGLYGLNAYTEPNETLKNIYVFISANLMLSALGSFNDLYSSSRQNEFKNFGFQIENQSLQLSYRVTF